MYPTFGADGITCCVAHLYVPKNRQQLTVEQNAQECDATEAQ